ncbi:MAG: YIP1 family protein [Dysgonamonadaceae bacterium]|jgi:hypothetical protein|nr:YIP1 family protein [Dysgonamonadaceae bacterium]
MFRKLFLRIYSLIVQPSKEWRTLAEEEQGLDRFLSTYFHPLLGIIALAAFAGALFARKGIEMALKSSILEFVIYFAGFYSVSFLLKEIMNRKYPAANIKRAPSFVVYASSLIYLISIVISLFGSSFQVAYLFLPYTLYIVWEGTTTYMEIEENKQIRFSVMCTVLLLLIPYFIHIIINKLMLS